MLDQPVSDQPSNILDKNVPNPVAKNPNFFTHKVVAAIGIILVGTILILFGLLYIYHINLADLFSTTPATDNTKVSTSSAKPTASSSAAKDETSGWKTYSNSKLGFSIKYPKDWDYNDQEKYLSDNCGPGLEVGENSVIFDNKNIRCEGVFEGIGGRLIISVMGEINPLEQLTPIQTYTYLSIDNVRAAKTFKTPTSEGPWCTCTRITLNHAGKGIQIQFVNKDLKGNYDTIIDKILSTFKFL